MNWAFWAGLAITYLAILIAFILLIAGAADAERTERKRQCMMNHPAGSLAKTEHSHSGQTKTISVRPNAIVPGTLVIEFEKRRAARILQGSGLAHNSLPHHWEDDK